MEMTPEKKNKQISVVNSPNRIFTNSLKRGYEYPTSPVTRKTSKEKKSERKIQMCIA